MRFPRTPVLLLALGAALAACATEPLPEPRADETFGQAVSAAQQRHRLHPEGARQRWDGAGIDGTPAYESVIRYHQSFKAPPPTFVIINAAPAGGGGGQ